MGVSPSRPALVGCQSGFLGNRGFRSGFVTAQYLSSYKATGNALRAFQIACGLACQLLFYTACSGVQAAVLNKYQFLQF